MKSTLRPIGRDKISTVYYSFAILQQFISGRGERVRVISNEAQG
jgi:hypothetical protein